MASRNATATRRAIAVDRLAEIQSGLEKQVGFTAEQQELYNRDNDYAQVQQIENVIAFLEALSESLKPKAKAKTGK